MMNAFGSSRYTVLRKHYRTFWLHYKMMDSDSLILVIVVTRNKQRTSVPILRRSYFSISISCYMSAVAETRANTQFC